MSSFLGKWASWIQYAHAVDKGYSKLVELANLWAGDVWVDTLLDLGSIVLFALATWRVIVLFV